MKAIPQTGLALFRAHDRGGDFRGHDPAIGGDIAADGLQTAHLFRTQPADRGVRGIRFIGMDECTDLLTDNVVAIAAEHRAERDVRVEDGAVQVGQHDADGRVTEDFFERLLAHIDDRRRLASHEGVSAIIAPPRAEQRRSDRMCR